jgi:hypothetical protein
MLYDSVKAPVQYYGGWIPETAKETPALSLPKQSGSIGLEAV